MAPLNPPIWLQAGTYPARYDRLAVASLLAPLHGTGPLAIRPGVRPTPSNAGLQVTQRSTPAMFVTVAAGSCYIQSASVTGGAYIVHNDAAYDVAITTAHATLPRKDLIVARIYDAEVSGALNQCAIEAIAGTPAGSPATPATPSGAIALAVVTVNAAATTIVNANIADSRSYTAALGGAIPAPSASMPANPYPGMAAYDLTNLLPKWHNGTTWRGWQDEGYQTQANVASYLSANNYVTDADLAADGYVTQTTLDAAGWTTYTPTWGASTTNPSLGNGTIQGRYKRHGKLVFVQVWLAFGSSSSLGSGLYSFSLPITAVDGWNPTSGNPFGRGGGTAMFNDSSVSNIAGGFAFLWDVGSGSADWRIRMISDAGATVSNSVPFAWATGDDIQVNLWYETQ
jgi:hypothetical protein